MAENYSLNSKFGFNVTKNTQNQQAQQTNVETNKNIGDLFASMTNFVSKYDDVFSGKVEHEINMYSRQAMIVGMNLKASETKRSFDMNI
ncbi:MAG: hypothetical protein E7Z88_00545 [Cyanobacteria bacterium SIG27]|nr:hypothetical protein [Cyanobacteria bacterium SIG27]